MDRKKSRAAIACLALLLGSGWVALAARSANPRKAEPPTPEPSRSFLDDPNLAARTELSLGSKELFFKMMFSVALVAILGLGALYLSKRVLPKVTKAPGREIHILETTYLGPRKALHLVEVGNHRLLIGSTNENISALAHVTDAWLDMARQELDEAVKL
jgi:flagellar biogenesis protein FliO